MNKIRVSMIEPVGGHGGMNYYDFNICESLTEKTEVDVTLYTCDETMTSNQNFSIIKNFKGIYGKENKFVRALRFIRGLLKSLFDSRRNRVHIVHYHFFHSSPLELLCILFAKIFRFKIVITTHDVESFSSGSSSFIGKINYKFADRIIAHNKVSKRELIDKLGIDPNKIDIIPHGNYIKAVNSNISREKAIDALGLKEHDCYYLLFFGQIKEVKGLEILIEALPEILKEHKKVKVIIAGRPWKNDFSPYINRIKQLGLEEHFVLHISYIADELVDYYFNAADIVVLPYKRIYQSGVLLKAMSYRKAVIASNLDGMMEIINDCQNGFLFESEDSHSLAKCVIRVLNNPEELSKVGQEAFETVKIKHDWDNIALRTVSTYKKILK